MKIRILDNNIRLRLSQSEVDQISSTQKVLSKTDFANHPLQYEIIGMPDVSIITVIFDGSKISVQVPKSTLLTWANSDEVGIENVDQSGIKLLIEKDFQCLHKRPGEDETDNFPNPLVDQI